MRLVNLSPQTIETFLAEKAIKGRLDGSGGLAPASVRRLRVTLHKALDAAVRKGLLVRNPADLAESPKVPRIDATGAVWTPQSIAEFVAATSQDRLSGVWRMASMTGMRRSKLCGLTWPDVDLDSGIISVRRAAVVVDGRRHLKSPKTPASRRALELDTGTVQALREWRARQLRERLRAGEAWQDWEWVVTDELGAPVHPDWLSILFTRRAKEAGLPRITIRQLRHSHATALLRAGAHPKVSRNDSDTPRYG